MKILSLIPARAGSKRVKNKNIRPFLGKPLIHHTIDFACKSNVFDKVLVTTDSEDIQKVSINSGAECPFLRPKEFAESHSSDFGYIQHSLTWLKENQNYVPDLVVLLRPTCPFRRTQDLEGLVNVFKNGQADSVRSISVTEGVHHPFWMFSKEDSNELKPLFEDKHHITHYQSQMLPPIYRLNGVMEGFSPINLEKYGNIYGDTISGFEVPLDYAIDIDTELDFKMAELYINELHTKKDNEIG